MTVILILLSTTLSAPSSTSHTPSMLSYTLHDKPITGSPPAKKIFRRCRSKKKDPAVAAF